MFLYGTPNLVSNMKASIHLFGGANDRGERAQSNCAPVVKSARLEALIGYLARQIKRTTKMN
jgi:hypothetical protein